MAKMPNAPSKVSKRCMMQVRAMPHVKPVAETCIPHDDGDGGEEEGGKTWLLMLSMSDVRDYTTRLRYEGETTDWV
jgi:hypothetical protein